MPGSGLQGPGLKAGGLDNFGSLAENESMKPNKEDFGKLAVMGGFEVFETCYSQEEARSRAADARAQGYTTRIVKTDCGESHFPRYEWIIYAREK